MLSDERLTSAIDWATTASTANRTRRPRLCDAWLRTSKARRDTNQAYFNRRPLRQRRGRCLPRAHPLNDRRRHTSEAAPKNDRCSGHGQTKLSTMAQKSLANSGNRLNQCRRLRSAIFHHARADRQAEVSDVAGLVAKPREPVTRRCAKSPATGYPARFPQRVGDQPSSHRSEADQRPSPIMTSRRPQPSPRPTGPELRRHQHRPADARRRQKNSDPSSLSPGSAEDRRTKAPWPTAPTARPTAIDPHSSPTCPRSGRLSDAAMPSATRRRGLATSAAARAWRSRARTAGSRRAGRSTPRRA